MPPIPFANLFELPIQVSQCVVRVRQEFEPSLLFVCIVLVEIIVSSRCVGPHVTSYGCRYALALILVVAFRNV